MMMMMTMVIFRSDHPNDPHLAPSHAWSNQAGWNKVHCVFICLCVCVCLYRSVCLCLCLCVCVCLFLSVCLCFCLFLSVSGSVFVFIDLFVCVCVCLYLSVTVFVFNKQISKDTIFRVSIEDQLWRRHHDQVFRLDNGFPSVDFLGSGLHRHCSSLWRGHTANFWT